MKLVFESKIASYRSSSLPHWIRDWFRQAFQNITTQCRSFSIRFVVLCLSLMDGWMRIIYNIKNVKKGANIGVVPEVGPPERKGTWFR